MKQPVPGVYKNDVAYEEDGGGDVQSISGPSSTKRRKPDNTKVSHKENTTESNKTSLVSHAEKLKYFMETKWKCHETDEDHKMSNNIISNLFAYALDHLLLRIFLFLDPFSLKASRQVCKQWEEFIKSIWRNEPGSLPYKSLRRRLDHHWRHANPNVKTISVGRTINCMSCDDSVVVCGMMKPTAMVFDIITLEIIIVLDMRDMIDMGNMRKIGRVSTDISKEVVCAVNANGYVCVWRKGDWSLLSSYQTGKSLLDAVRMINNYIITADCCGWMAVMRFDNNQITLISTIEKHPSTQHLHIIQTICNFDSDGIWILVGKSTRLHLWRLDPCQKVKSIEADPIGMLSVNLYYPFAFVASDADGVTVFDLEKEEKVMSYLRRVSFCDVHNNGRFIGALTSTHKRVTLCSIEELTNVKMAQEKFWNRSKILPSEDGNGFGKVKVALNTSCLVTALGKKVYVWDFWNCANANVNPGPYTPRSQSGGRGLEGGREYSKRKTLTQGGRTLKSSKKGMEILETQMVTRSKMMLRKMSVTSAGGKGGAGDENMSGDGSGSRRQGNQIGVNGNTTEMADCKPNQKKRIYKIIK